MSVSVSKELPAPRDTRPSQGPRGLRTRPALKDTLAGGVPNVVARWGRRLHFLRVGKLSQQPSLEVFPTLILFAPVNEDLALETVTLVTQRHGGGRGVTARAEALVLGEEGRHRACWRRTRGQAAEVAPSTEHPGQRRRAPGPAEAFAVPTDLQAHGSRGRPKPALWLARND